MIQPGNNGHDEGKVIVFRPALMVGEFRCLATGITVKRWQEPGQVASWTASGTVKVHAPGVGDAQVAVHDLPLADAPNEEGMTGISRELIGLVLQKAYHQVVESAEATVASSMAKKIQAPPPGFKIARG